EEYISIEAFDQLYDSFNWSSIDPTIALQLGLKNITFFYTNHLSWYNISISNSLNYDQLIYEITGYGDPVNTTIQNIMGIQRLRIANYSVDEFTIILEGTSILIKISERYRYLLSPQYTDQIEVQFFEFSQNNSKVLNFNDTSEKWYLNTLGLNYFNISKYLSLVEGDQFLFWFLAEDGLGNQLDSHKTRGIYDNLIVQNPQDQDMFQWHLGTNSTGSGIVLFGSIDYLDSTIQIDVSSIIQTANSEIDVQRILLYGSNNSNSWDYKDILGRAYFSGVEDIWNFYWDGDLLETIPPENYYLRILTFDRAGNYLIQTHAVKLFDYTQIQLLTDLVFGHAFNFNFTALSNVQNIDGVITNFFDSTNVWNVISEYYNPNTREWIPLVYDSSIILTNGSYSITWDIN
ncbi:hypothetical protein LCGC14_2828110, partial [marine sediment metagenome]